MKIVFISDIHGKETNLYTIENIIKECDKLVVLGDIYYPGRNASAYNREEVYNFLLKYKDKIICMRGNCDSDVDITSTDFPILSDISLLNVDNINMYLTHGDKYNIDHNKIINGVLLYGHIHYPFIIQKENITYINVGSISYPKNNSEPCYVIYENKTFTIYNLNNQIIDNIQL